MRDVRRALEDEAARDFVLALLLRRRRAGQRRADVLKRADRGNGAAVAAARAAAARSRATLGEIRGRREAPPRAPARCAVGPHRARARSAPPPRSRTPRLVRPASFSATRADVRARLALDGAALAFRLLPRVAVGRRLVGDEGSRRASRRRDARSPSVEARLTHSSTGAYCSRRRAAAAVRSTPSAPATRKSALVRLARRRGTAAARRSAATSARSSAASRRARSGEMDAAPSSRVPSRRSPAARARRRIARASRSSTHAPPRRERRGRALNIAAMRLELADPRRRAHRTCRRRAPPTCGGGRERGDRDARALARAPPDARGAPWRCVVGSSSRSITAGTGLGELGGSAPSAADLTSLADAAARRAARRRAPRWRRRTSRRAAAEAAERAPRRLVQVAGAPPYAASTPRQQPSAQRSRAARRRRRHRARSAPESAYAAITRPRRGSGARRAARAAARAPAAARARPRWKSNVARPSSRAKIRGSARRDAAAPTRRLARVAAEDRGGGPPKLLAAALASASVEICSSPARARLPHAAATPSQRRRALGGDARRRSASAAPSPPPPRAWIEAALARSLSRSASSEPTMSARASAGRRPSGRAARVGGARLAHLQVARASDAPTAPTEETRVSPANRNRRDDDSGGREASRPPDARRVRPSAIAASRRPGAAASSGDLRRRRCTPRTPTPAPPRCRARRRLPPKSARASWRRAAPGARTPSGRSSSRPPRGVACQHPRAALAAASAGLLVARAGPGGAPAPPRGRAASARSPQPRRSDAAAGRAEPRPTSRRSFRVAAALQRNSCLLDRPLVRPRSRVRPGGPRRVKNRRALHTKRRSRSDGARADPRTRSRPRRAGLGVPRSTWCGAPRPFARLRDAASRARACARPRRRRSRASDPRAANRGSRERASSGPRRVARRRTRRGSVYSRDRAARAFERLSELRAGRARQEADVRGAHVARGRRRRVVSSRWRRDHPDASTRLRGRRAGARSVCTSGELLLDTMSDDVVTKNFFAAATDDHATPRRRPPAPASEPTLLRVRPRLRHRGEARTRSPADRGPIYARSWTGPTSRPHADKPPATLFYLRWR